MDLVPVARLEREWRRQLAGRELAACFARWRAREGALRRFTGPAGVLAFLRRSARGEAQDAVLRALLSRARGDPAAGGLVLHALLPGLKRLSARLLVDTREQEELWSALLACAWQRIRTYPVERRPRRVAANLLLDTLHDAVGAHRVAVRARAELDVVPARPPVGGPQIERDVEAVMARAVQAGAVTAAEAELILRTRIDGVALVALAASEGVAYDALRVRRRRAERRLLVHLGVADVRSGGAGGLLGAARVAGRGPAGSAGGSDQSSHSRR
jgi:DNA-directed RNA polymerase specialized sigma24 family protein